MNDNPKVFFDTNVLVYFADESDPKKQKIADELIKNAIFNENGIISIQSLQEFLYATTRKYLCSKEKAKEYVETFKNSLAVEQVSVSLILKAIDISMQTQFSFWDSLIISAASETGCVVCYSEDMNDGQVVDGVKILNPFAA